MVAGAINSLNLTRTGAVGLTPAAPLAGDVPKTVGGTVSWPA
jgi:hypothetical protein